MVKRSSHTFQLFMICVTTAAISLFNKEYVTILNEITATIQMTGSQIGAMATILIAATVLAGLLSALQLRVMNHSKLLAGSLLSIVLGTWIMGLATAPWAILTSRAFLGYGVGATFTCLTSLIIQLPKSIHLLAFGWFGAARQLGVATGSILMPLLSAWFGTWQDAYFALATPMLFLALYWLLVLPEEQKHPVEAPSLLFQRLWDALRSRILWICATAHIMTFGIGNAVSFWVTPYLMESFGLPLPIAAGIALVFPLCGLLRPLINLPWLKRQPFAHQMYGFLALSALGCCLLLSPSLPVVLTGLVLLSISSTMPYGLIAAKVANESEQQEIGGALRLALFQVMFLPAVAFPPFIGALKDIGGYPSAFFALGLIAGMVGLCSIIPLFHLQSSQKERMQSHHG